MAELCSLLYLGKDAHSQTYKQAKNQKGSEKRPLRWCSKRQTAQKWYLKKTTMAITLNKGKGLKKRFHGSKVWWQTSKVQKTCLIYSWGAISVLTAFTTICFAVSAKLGVKDDLGSHLILAWYFHSLFLKQFLPEKRSQSTKTLSFLQWQIPLPISQRLSWGQKRSGFHLLLWQVRWGHGKTEKIQHFTGFIDQKGINIPNAFTF